MQEHKGEAALPKVRQAVISMCHLCQGFCVHGVREDDRVSLILLWRTFLVSRTAEEERQYIY